MTLEVEVNVMVRNVRWDKDDGWYTGKFTFQQIAPLSPIIVDKNGNVNLMKAGVSGDVEIDYNWCSNAVEIEGDLYPAYLADPPCESFWLGEKNKYPGPADPAPQNGGELWVPSGTGRKKLKMKDGNLPDKHYTYCFALKIGMVGEPWLVADPKIVNKGTNRLLSYEGSEQSS